MRLYKFMPVEFALENIAKRRLKISRIGSLNDPFEYAAVTLRDRETRKHWLSVRNEISKTSGLISFCKTWTNPVVWAHYTKDHEGICLGLDIPETSVFPVEYVATRLDHVRVFDEGGLLLSDKIPNPIFVTKYDNWSYEQEYRGVFKLKDKPAENGLHFMRIEMDSLKEVILGDRCILRTQQIADALGASTENVSIYRARPAFGKFAMTRQLNKKLAR